MKSELETKRYLEENSLKTNSSNSSNSSYNEKYIESNNTTNNARIPKLEMIGNMKKN
jgi:hypothetical protein